MQTDHINHNKLDNRRNNLRICTPSQNQANKVIGLGNHSGAKGVCYSNARNKWRSQIGFHGKKITIGYFNNVNDAITAYAKKAIELYGEFACTG
jgi:hypothetical protein